MTEFTVPEKCKRVKLNPEEGDPEHRIVVVPPLGFASSPSIKKKDIPLVLCSYCDADTLAAAIRAHDIEAKKLVDSALERNNEE